MLTINIPKERPKSLMKTAGKWSVLSLDSRTPPPEIEPDHLYDATILISGKTALRVNLQIAVGSMESFDSTTSYFVGVWVPTEFLADDLRLEIEIIGPARELDMRAFLGEAPLDYE
ncbi:hypothetical protein ABIB57_001110 [Devosia sp. UYZn731]|uniref:hypothetical protein n=1 Tax=Devosia sp. UYZn731 TaxID=3156345 RepID=UPI003396D649